MASVAVDPQPSVVTRVANLPLVSSTYDLVSSAYVSTKDQHPYLRSVCEMAEKGVRTVTSVAVTGALPIIQKLEPQIAVANTYACKGLDRMEARLPILNQPTSEIVANARGAVTGAKDVVTTTMAGAKDSVASTVSGVVDKTKGAVTGSVERTKSVVNGGIDTVLGMVQLMSSGVENAISKSELLVDQYLPLTQKELEMEAKKVEGFDMVQKQRYYERLESLSTKICTRAYHQALGRIKDAKQKGQETISQLHSTVHLNVHSANQKIQDKLSVSWVEWKRIVGYDDTDESHCAEHIESHTLSMARNLTQQLHTTCQTLLFNVQGLPQNIQDQAKHLGVMAGDIYSAFRNVTSFKEVSDGVLTSSKGQLQKMKESLDEVMDYLVNNTPLNWLVGPFYPQSTEVDKASLKVQQSELTTQ
ncbi:perilipin-2 isoform 3 [Rattus norvegicus]|uniref:perilipin-2 isoform 3 n=1 Tax=Rattus norvegicus TaxID=10116 RepID=UPI0003D0976D|nr:perilipin-2 isoform 3 [Rattus norvegicus]XP_038965448.1 perilipin-2 isoform X3 [Rattus norvegicus]|eukprot:XP_008762000.1 PREDICTED: perilipin-2 isoform X2 [Rattus norvegicus]